MSEITPFSPVHDLQRVYRKVIDAFARPGLIVDLEFEASRLDLTWAVFPATLLLMRLLLDAEVTFKLIVEQEDDLAQKLGQLTGAKAAPTDQADFVFVLMADAHNSLADAIGTAKAGSLAEPHRSATLIVEAESIGHLQQWVLRGPGITGRQAISVTGPVNWASSRADKNAEYPLGIDLIFVDRNHRLLALPRTTQITGLEDPWAT